MPDTEVAARATTRPPVAAVSRWTLAALVVGSVVGAGVFSLPGEFSRSAGALGAGVAWVVVGAGMGLIALTFLYLSQRRPDLDAGVYSYAREGFGRYAGFLSAFGYYLTAVVGNVAYWVLIMSTLGEWVPAVRDGSTPAAIALSSVGVWVYHVLITRGIHSAAAINRIVTVAKLVPLAAFVVVAAFAFDPVVFADNLGGDGPVLDQVRSTMLVTVFVFIGIEGASVYSRFARRRADVGWATMTGYVGVLALFALVTMVSYGIMPRAEMARLDQPSVGGVLEHVLGGWGGAIVGVGLVVSVLGAYLAWTLMACRVVVEAAHRGDMPAVLARENRRGAPVAAVTMTSVLVQLFLLTVLGSDDAFTVALSLCSSLVLVPYLLSALLALRTAGADARGTAGGPRRWVAATAGAAAYAVFLVWAGGPAYLLLTFVIYAPASLVHVWARRADASPFSAAERVAAVLVVALAVLALVGLGVGWFSL